MGIWKTESEAVGGLLYAILTVCLGRERADRWYRPVVRGLVVAVTVVALVLLALVIYEAARSDQPHAEPGAATNAVAPMVCGSRLPLWAALRERSLPHRG